MKPERLAEIRGRHQFVDLGDARYRGDCHECGHPWPCPTSTDIDELLAEVERLQERNEATNPGIDWDSVHAFFNAPLKTQKGSE